MIIFKIKINNSNQNRNYQVGLLYDLYANECLVTIGPSVNNQVINIATNCPRTDGQAGDNNMGGEYLAYVYKIT